MKNIKEYYPDKDIQSGRKNDPTKVDPTRQDEGDNDPTRIRPEKDKNPETPQPGESPGNPGEQSHSEKKKGHAL